MSKYLIHAIEKRMWYVNDYLIPSIVNQGIPSYNISVFCDNKCYGNLKAFTESLKTIKEDTWHLQDDVVIGSKFASVTTSVKEGIVCGFCSSYSSDKQAGRVNVEDMWYSFPCIRIPVTLSNEFLEWLDTDALQNSTYKTWIEANKYDDSLFMEFLKQKHSTMTVYNLKPNLVEHVDYLIGGSVVNKIRDYKKAQSIYFNEKWIVDELREELKNGESR